MSLQPLDRWQGQDVEALRAEWGLSHLEVHASVGSTEDRARELALSGVDGFTAVIALEQTAGRGRRGSAWYSPSGYGLWISLVLDPPDGFAGALTLRLGLVAARAVDSLVPEVRTGIKWPNDLWLDGRKVGGILCAAVGQRVVAGIGLNLGRPEGGYPDSLAGIAISVEETTGKVLHPKDMAARLIPGIGELTGRSGDAEWLEDLEAIAERHVLADRPVVTEAYGDGTARSIDIGGSLILERPDGSMVRVAGGSVSLR